ncbi:uncharacterized protein LOC127248590 [Andrographis paniculata]|uniref:uncharacterized protein LOC127248590 n=1 Tax=Andrographis paniculata TaxID=175694 RepID=UPI0021E8AFDD|nr:uncharacterized protein LOC127248590 [Andrographis paniculata]
MQHFSRWRNVFTLNNTIAESAKIGIATTAHLASFHSTGAVLEKWKNKFNFEVRGDRQSSKTYVRYVVRQKRADTKKALKSILYNGGCSASKTESFSRIEADFADQLNKKSRAKSARQAKKACQKKLHRRRRREDEDDERIFHGTFGKGGFNWTFRPSEMGFNWTKSSGWNYSRFHAQDCRSRIEYDNSCTIGTYADRKILGLPISGALKMEDVKTAFRSAALKWHPDKHQGPLQASAEDKFKQCAEAYKSLCNALSQEY